MSTSQSNNQNQPSLNTMASPRQDSLALVVVDQNEGSANANSGVLPGGVLQADMLINSSKRLQDDLQSLGRKIKKHEDNIKSLKAQKHILDDSILDKQVILGKYHSSAPITAEDRSLSNGGEEETTEQILKHDKSAAGIWCQLINSHGNEAPNLALSKDIIGIVATLGKVADENLSRLLSEYLGAETMLTIVCKTREGIKALETYNRDGSIDKCAGLHGLSSSIGRILNGRFLLICLEELRPYVGDFVADDGQRRLDLFKPRFPNGECPPGFLGFAVNMIDIDATHLVCLTPSGHGLRETLFYHLFSRVQVYSTRLDMLRALPVISGGAISLDGGIIRGPGVYSLGKREDVPVRFPVPSGASSRPANYRVVENQMRDLKGKREKLLEDLQRERQMLDHAKLAFDRKKQEFVMFLAQSSSYATQVHMGSNPMTPK
ncbi:protein DEFECTIVE IN MERISTEM SILENCING 3 isoform X1 [Rhodamnia argentea]|uniref:Protein DEFECTIVE IN MERISTEM SILENCING 3 isoform X1 n=2 Tax=Rhodamnia argentea TaxID=178133 RepID=A0ABM3HW73_9MYRT|nr:protein DEFECTIVE IN MERISTEM SILENCING 3 isoform X1 [Rhodamnia argentea]